MNNKNLENNSTTNLDWNLLLDDCVDFTQELIRTPSMSHQEAEIAKLIAAELKRLGFDEVAIDEAGNVIGRIYGQDRRLPALVLNTHLDHVDPGDLALWPAPPYAGTIVDGRIIGRGASDIKGPLAVQVYAMAALRRAFSGIVAGNVKEDGMRAVAEHGPFRLQGDAEVISALDELLRDFARQGRMKIDADSYTPCFTLD